MVNMEVEYGGDLHCKIIHGPSGKMIETDAPIDNMGKGESFSPTDLIGASLASCIATTIAIYANRKGWNMAGMKVTVKKEMHPAPDRRIACLPVVVYIPLSLNEEDRKTVERIASTCPVHKSLVHSIEIPMTFQWALK